MLICPNCSAQNRDAAHFCHQCAAPFAASPTGRAALICPICLTSNPPHARFCLNCATALRGQAPSAGLTGKLPANTILNNRYTVVRKIGQGGMGSVYLVSDNRLHGKYWALKEMSASALVDLAEKRKAIEAFKLEATLLASLNHANLAKVSDYFEQAGKHYLVMDYITGETLDDLLAKWTVPAQETRAIQWALQLCDVLNYLHNLVPPVIFRDLKPGNIMIDRKGQARLIDFGIARLFKPGKQRDTASFGTAGYAPPEQYGRGQTDARSDVYSLAATLHQLLTLRDPGDEPFKFPLARSLNPAISQHVSDALDKALRQDPGERWQSSARFAQALKNPTIAPARAKPASAAPKASILQHGSAQPAKAPNQTPNPSNSAKDALIDFSAEVLARWIDKKLRKP
jgi:serine/threonine-protein kinase